ncbi:predicted protein [Streptomyces filamentosus NRRL 15998]|uniref:Predicted protein n=1 Tax=Streptomyces filamentosus NRRL 15998 TaxID=457431 RepID=D6AQV5_STRFL|nr:predicted protein [Streptomyces filamentosus NRRL 15998]
MRRYPGARAQSVLGHLGRHTPGPGRLPARAVDPDVVVIRPLETSCGFATPRALTGPLAGTVWWDGRATCDLIVPLSLDHAGGGRPAAFCEWLGRDSWDLLPPDSRPRRWG